MGTLTLLLPPGHAPPDEAEVCKVVGTLVEAADPDEGVELGAADDEAALLEAVVDAADDAGALPDAAVAIHAQTAEALLTTWSAVASPQAEMTQFSAEA